MRVFVKAKPLSGREQVEKIDGTHFVIWVKEPPERGLANRAVIKAAADYFQVPIATVRIVSGFTSRQKVLLVG
ncbi:DUF167 domain-containing protein [Patescibacteria group bacterium]|nr:MAG: DUF167 domain-containing protein [Patescibacteria group bacterium]